MFSKKNKTLQNITPTQVNVVIHFFNEKDNGYENLTMVLFIFHIRAVPIKLSVCIIGVLTLTRFEINLPE